MWLFLEKPNNVFSKQQGLCQTLHLHSLWCIVNTDNKKQGKVQTSVLKIHETVQKVVVLYNRTLNATARNADTHANIPVCKLTMISSGPNQFTQSVQ